MQTQSFPCPRLVRHGLFACMALSLYAPLAQANKASAPTASTLTQEQADLRWQQAMRRFDPARHAMLDTVAQGAAQGPFHPDWASLRAYRAPAWFANAKFGIFVHWGVYSVPAFANEWYPRNMYDQRTREYAHQVATHGSLAHFGYKDYIPLFKAEHWDPARWAALFRAAGARYVVGVAEFTFVATQVNNREQVYPLEIFAFIALAYFVVCGGLQLLGRWSDRRWSLPARA